MGTQAAQDDPLTLRVLQAFQSYDRTYASAGVDLRPGTVAAASLARARLDLALALCAAGVDLDDVVEEQLSRDGDDLLRTTPEL